MKCTCEDCRGIGHILWRQYAYEYTETCETCGGSGEIEIEEEEEEVE